MAVLLESGSSASMGDARPPSRADDPPDRPCLEIGLVNNMPDGALQATEQQFTALLGAAAGNDVSLRLHLFSLPGVPRSPATRAAMAGTYSSLDTRTQRPLDALIVTGCEPRASRLTEEPYWADIAALVDWAGANTRSTLWSCLAAHAAVLHLDGIERRRLPGKLSGVFECQAAADHPLLAGAARPPLVPHSRWNTLDEEALAASGYTVLTRSPEIGVDLFIRDGRSAFVFLQGHPEYGADAIAREYRRDVARFLRGEQGGYPCSPRHYFDPAIEDALAAVETVALADRRRVGLRDLPRAFTPRSGLADRWRATAVAFYRNWLTSMVSNRR